MMGDIPKEQLIGGVESEFWFVLSGSFQKLSAAQMTSLEGTIEEARKRLSDEISRVAAALKESGSQANPETLAERIREVRRRMKVLSDITGLQVAIGAAGKS